MGMEGGREGGGECVWIWERMGGGISGRICFKCRQSLITSVILP